MATSLTAADHDYMARALRLAQRAMNITTPNPRVGCVLVRDGQIIGEGHTQPAGSHHAEVDALIAARHEAAGATAYVTLEPCSHQGRTPPCVDALIQARVRRVVAAMQDPNPQVAGQGFARLQAAGIETQWGLLAAEAHEINIGFVVRMTRGRPWLRLKMAASLDGKTALNNGTSQWITGVAARADGHRWRARACAILTGIGTVLEDDPRLTARPEHGVENRAENGAENKVRQPLKVIIDSRLETPPTARLLQEGSTLIAAACEDVEKMAVLRARGAEVVVLPDARGKVDLAALMQELARRGINEVHGEAGHKLSGSLLGAGLVDELLLYYAPTLLGTAARGMFQGPELIDLAGRLDFSITDLRRLGDDIRIMARPR
ncbi:MAG: bifunctional diaminohydroxyphosphoribosylaminopyrimidine deaminase/5-amino-6-(5-phosphoribosylamino)uracil reductase RibD [Sterolibacterium sp.]|nr:bifunctional diaminohydroxyphosphoribosylaminopyrimidine deaminase/5-amino-6-(5-phosphoribosylamino)uracil reductase RibD [Sterolibacterium sp.]